MATKATNPLPPPIHVPFRPGEAAYIVPSGDSLTVVFAYKFEQPSDAVIGRVFLQEFQDARKQPALRSAPTCKYAAEPPREILDLGFAIPDTETVSFLSVVLFETHIKAGDPAHLAHSLATLRTYVLYHLKCTKAFQQSRMRKRSAEWLAELKY
jgi:actin related protein 2/3 complex subunit 2|eukprot:gnl/Ergobibamus_cyprinoides/1118.p2 GENE.gnl/Ergobibamus_cyprinoides/1118~~gnl/Ergobibamus_cyprinoides/1118.p2  ORF type:complete len:154 (+),score=32.87 gnl/Ergobibamus_cyprinoides/1118:449-910(+)